MKSFLTLLAALLALCALGFLLGSYESDVYRKLLLWIALGLSFNFLFGISGQVAFSHFVFLGFGAYWVAISLVHWDLPLAVAIASGLLVAAVAAAMIAIPSTRLEGPYLALATLALGQLFLLGIASGRDLTGGDSGLGGYSLPPILGFTVKGPWYTACIVLMLGLTYVILDRLDRSSFGRACRAIRDNQTAAQAMGINAPRTKVIAFTITSVLASLAGIFYAFVDNLVAPGAFSLESMFILLFMVIVGGTGRQLGAIIGVVVLYMAPFFIEPLIGHYHFMAFGALVVILIIYKPNGLVSMFDPILKRRRMAALEKAQL
ncbi:branched-chain amino acid ABC transporter permease [Mesorhizobium sp.]|uniref:branched-chain amino acid ABC transporter permease n=1 Tax=Mesorhizobium sp. TaxID=1871066 RepID=UPI000FE92B5F|nr:branched-chain amino acid ABC transporter permease [Mesorhizobium sp.]RWM45478.1 MAG: branched-chain amino acid ABC transporter permease [Mesorhizobium sp.]RWM58202.1 MAG: branched-chain amino acid ABC transporter permease [Mesorhizobium sp.]RWM58633.1 MAG: branched-chain amino acid ABC transporter permease [Mesorhizobium sp.]TIO70068.1 MAG: branched-chain amino acid ABC transporter permease [Mesorhizobium sp.]TJV93958.1 MAG: branched-chain amino acid ABC transporter permease [Mesorhizobium